MTKKINAGQAVTVLAAILAALSQNVESLQAVLPPQVVVTILAVTNLISAVLPKIWTAKPE